VAKGHATDNDKGDESGNKPAFNGRRTLILGPEAFHKATNLTGCDLSLLFKMPHNYIKFFKTSVIAVTSSYVRWGWGPCRVVLANGVKLMLAEIIFGVELRNG